MATKTPVRPPTIRDPNDQFQREVNRAVKQSNAVQQDARTYVRGQLVNTTSTPVKHGLGRIPVGFVVTDLTAQATIWRDSSVKATADTIFLKGSSAVVVDLMFW